MREYIKMFKNWYSINKPSKKYWIILFLTALFPAFCYVLEPVFAANVITNMNSANYNYVYLFLALAFIFVLLRNLSWHLNYLVFNKFLGDIYMRLQGNIFDKITNSKEVNFKKNSKEKLINIIHTDVYDSANFGDLLATKMSRLFRVIMTLGMIFYINVYCGIIVLVISIINYFVLDKIVNKLVYYKKKIAESKDNLYEKFSEVVDARYIINDLNILDKNRKGYLQAASKYVKAKSKQTIYQSYNDNFFYVFYNALILIVTLFLVFLVSNGSVNLTLYFVVVPYISSSLDTIINFMGIFSDLRSANLSALRIKTVLDFTPKELIEFGNNENDDIFGAIEFNNVSFSHDDKDDSYHGRIHNISFSVKENDIVLFMGPKNCGKRIIFYLLRRIIKPADGYIYLDGVNIYNYDEVIHKSNVNYLTTKPFFFSGSIMKNLCLVEKDSDLIYEMCKDLGIHDFINSLPMKYNTNINKGHLIPEEKKYLIGLARTLLTRSEVIMLYEFPTGLSALERENIKKVLDSLRGTRTIIIFSGNDECIPLADRVIKLSNGKIVEEFLNNK